MTQMAETIHSSSKHVLSDHLLVFSKLSDSLTSNTSLFTSLESRQTYNANFYILFFALGSESTRRFGEGTQ